MRRIIAGNKSLGDVVLVIIGLQSMAALTLAGVGVRVGEGCIHCVVFHSTAQLPTA